MRFMEWWKRHAPWSFINTDTEIHSFWLGLFRSFPAPWPERYQITKETEYDPRKELHYYAFGRSLGLLLDGFLYYGLYRLFS